jgi:hypothetical protein
MTLKRLHELKSLLEQDDDIATITFTLQELSEIFKVQQSLYEISKRDYSVLQAINVMIRIAENEMDRA